MSSVFEAIPELEALCNQDGNRLCVDCNAPKPDWVSLGFGVLLCLECAGVHRGFGTHITLVRSVSMDTWTTKQISALDHGGNVKFKSFLATTITAKDLSSISSGDKKSMYMLPEVLHYKKILAASIAGQECAPYEPATNNNINTAINPKHVPKPKASPLWVQDSEAMTCMLCTAAFTLINRRHHCRCCGRCVCNVCAPKENTRPILEWKIGKAVRHCYLCYKSPVLSWPADSQDTSTPSPAT